MSKVSSYEGWAIITGASSGIGLELAKQIAEEGLHCVLVARSEDKLIALAEEIEEEYEVATLVLALDLATEEGIDALLEGVDDLDISMIVNNAGFGDGGAFHTRDPERIAEMIKLNCLAPALITRSLLPYLLERENGAIITVASILALVPCPLEATYAATKAFDLSFSEGLAGELKGTGIDVLALCPALTETGFLEAEGMDEDRIQHIYRKAVPAATIATMALDALGKCTVIGPRDFKLLSFGRRLLPGKMINALAAAMSKNLLEID